MNPLIDKKAAEVSMERAVNLVRELGGNVTIETMSSWGEVYKTHAEAQNIDQARVPNSVLIFRGSFQHGRGRV